MRVLGITGGIGSGKSSISEILKNYGAEIIDADKIAREILNKGSKAFTELVSYFGLEILTADGDLNRKKLSDIVFTDNIKLEKLNAITHKFIAERIYFEIQNCKTEVIVLDVVLPIKNGFLDVAEEIWTVLADDEIRIKRIIDRSNLTRNQIVERMAFQADEEHYKKIANKVIYNNGTLDELEKQIKEKYCEFINRKIN